jgi:hypothetical protein
MNCVAAFVLESIVIQIHTLMFDQYHCKTRLLSQHPSCPRLLLRDYGGGTTMKTIHHSVQDWEELRVLQARPQAESIKSIANNASMSISLL